MNLAGISTLEIGGYSEVETGGNALEVVLVLDNTYSMTAEGRMDALKKASHALVDQLYANSGKGIDVKVSIVPFGEYVNVGIANRNKPWIDVQPDKTTTTKGVTTYPNGKCLAERQVTAYNDGVPYQTTECTNWDPGAPVTTDVTYTEQWRGCVGSRPDPLDEAIDSMATHYEGLVNGWCNAEVTELTDKKSVLDNQIDAMYPAGETYIPAGLLWGWNMLDASEPFGIAKSAAAMKKARGSKALILMTDGESTRSATYPWHWGSDEAQAEKKTSALCENIKGSGISVYTVSLKVTKQTAIDLLANCASSPAQAFNAEDNTALVSSFKQIAGSLAAVHITK
jgi:Mg-chelatase subunit ChlD